MLLMTNRIDLVLKSAPSWRVVSTTNLETHFAAKRWIKFVNGKVSELFIKLWHHFFRTHLSFWFHPPSNWVGWKNLLQCDDRIDRTEPRFGKSLSWLALWSGQLSQKARAACQEGHNRHSAAWSKVSLKKTKNVKVYTHSGLKTYGLTVITLETMFGTRMPLESWTGTAIPPLQKICHWQGLGSNRGKIMTMSCIPQDPAKQ